MGQYFTAYIESEDGHLKKTFSPYRFDNGFKLMEHSYINNIFMNAVCNAILNKPSKVVWVGDFAEYSDLNEKMRNVFSDESMFDKFVSDIAYDDYGQSASNDLKFDYVKNKYLINNDKKEFVDFNKTYDANKNSEYLVHPLSLLTAIGNGNGGGDYYKENPDADKVGTWAFDEIYISDTVPKDYVEHIYCFIDL